MELQKLGVAVPQYSLMAILGIWASVALPMGLIYWVVRPILIPRVDIEPGFLYFILITLGLVWQGVVAYIILRREVKPFTWEGLKDRLWLYSPSNPKTSFRSKWLYLWTIPLIVFANVASAHIGWLNELMLKAIPFQAARQSVNFALFDANSNWLFIRYQKGDWKAGGNHVKYL